MAEIPGVHIMGRTAATLLLTPPNIQMKTPAVMALVIARNVIMRLTISYFETIISFPILTFR
jgi:hypothetical protein